jgi:DNA repair protein RecN (Recombination protein N)
MLREFYVENFGLIENIQVDLSQGLNVLTGETGAGKSLIIDAVGLLIGGRGSQDFIRTNAEKLFVQGVFSGEFSQDLILLLSEAGMDLEDDTLILNRELFRTGKNVCRINYRTVPLSLFKEVGKRLINIHGQHEYINFWKSHTSFPNWIITEDGIYFY